MSAEKEIVVHVGHRVANEPIPVETQPVHEPPGRRARGPGANGSTMRYQRRNRLR